MKKQIFTDKEGREFLRKVYKCTDTMIWKALTFDSDSELAKKIRKTIHERQGIIGNVGLSQPSLDVARVKFEDGQIVANIGHGVCVVYDKEWEVATMTVDGEEKEVLITSSINEFMNLVVSAYTFAFKRYLKAFL